MSYAVVAALRRIALCFSKIHSIVLLFAVTCTIAATSTSDYIHPPANVLTAPLYRHTQQDNPLSHNAHIWGWNSLLMLPLLLTQSTCTSPLLFLAHMMMTRVHVTHAVTIQELTASNANVGDLFGMNGVSFDGTRALIGAAMHDCTDQPHLGCGAAYIFELVGLSWVQTAMLRPADIATWTDGGNFGSSTDLYNNLAIIGAPGHLLSGRAYIFEYIANSWVQKAELSLADDGLPTDNGYFGAGVAIWDKFAIAGGGSIHYGSYAFVYELVGNSWSFKQQLIGFGGFGSIDMGCAAAMTNNVAVVGATNYVGEGSGFVYRYDGSDWLEDTRLGDGGGGADSFGRAIGIDPSGDTIIFGVLDAGPANTGAAYIFEYNAGTSTWDKTTLTASDAGTGQLFGASVSIYGDLAIVGSNGHDVNTGNSGLEAGAAYFFAKNGGTWGETVLWLNPNQGYHDYLGDTVSLYGDIAFIGGRRDGTSGVVYAYDMVGTYSPTKYPTTYPTTSPTKYPTTSPTQTTLDPTTSPTSPTSYPTSAPTQPSLGPTMVPTADPTADPTTEPTTEPTVEPTSDPTKDPTADPTTEPTVEPTMDPTKDPTRDPTIDPTVDPTRDPTMDPTRDPTVDPTIDPTTDPTIDPTIDPTTDPTDDPTNDPSMDPTGDPTQDPTNDPSKDPTSDPTNDPTKDPTVDPTMDPTADPTFSPTDSPSGAPTVSPSVAPHSLERAIEMSLTEEGSSMNQTYIYIILFGIPALIICFVFVMKSTVLKDKLLSIDRVEYISVGLYFLQVFDLYSDAMFTLQLYAYYDWAKHTNYEITSGEINEFWFLFLFSLIFTILPYCANFVSSGRIVAMITSDPIISIYSKEWFKYNSGVYSIGVLLSGGSYFTLKAINSNFLGLPQLSAGLSDKQIERFSAHKVLYNSLMENLPQMVIQFYFLWGLGLVTSLAVIALLLSVFNILLSVLSTWMRRSSFAFQKEFPFTVHLSIMHRSDGDSNANPYRNAGRIERLSDVLRGLARANKHHFSIETMTFSRIEKSLYGVVIYKDAKVEDIKAFLDNNMEKAVLGAFEWDDYAFSVTCYYPMDSFNLDEDENTGTNTKKTKYKKEDGSHVIEVEMKKVRSDDDDEGEGEGAEAGGTDLNRIALPESEATTAGGSASLSVEQILLQSWNLGQYWNKIEALGYDDHKFWKTMIKKTDVLAQIFGATKGHEDRFVESVQQMK